MTTKAVSEIRKRNRAGKTWYFRLSSHGVNTILSFTSSQLLPVQLIHTLLFFLISFAHSPSHTPLVCSMYLFSLTHTHAPSPFTLSVFSFSPPFQSKNLTVQNQSENIKSTLNPLPHLFWGFHSNPFSHLTCLIRQLQRPIIVTKGLHCSQTALFEPICSADYEFHCSVFSNKGPSLTVSFNQMDQTCVDSTPRLVYPCHKFEENISPLCSIRCNLTTKHPA